jgi:hypothetical protein
MDDRVKIRCPACIRVFRERAGIVINHDDVLSGKRREEDDPG